MPLLKVEGMMEKDTEIKALVDRAVKGDREALEGVVVSVQDDLYNLAMRMLGGRAEAEDATQEVLVQIVTHLAQWRGDASFRTWCWRIAVRHLMRSKKSKDEEVASFEMIEQLIEMGNTPRALPALGEAELSVLEAELRIACTQGMLSSLDRDQRVSWILAEVFELDSNQAADVLDVDAATHRKRVSRARERLGKWMHQHCGLVNQNNPCRCRRQIPVAIELGGIDPQNIQFATHPERPSPKRKMLPVLSEADELNLAAYTLCCHPDYAAPDKLVSRIRELLEAGTLRLLS
jgi:RNA polymerase sigma factor (sigma-70 family)